MKVVLFARSDAQGGLGGDMVQAAEYAAHLRAAGVETTLWSRPEPPRGRFDVGHVFNLDLPLEAARQVRQARACCERVVLSTIHHRERWMKDLHRVGRAGAARLLARAVPLAQYEALRGAWVARRRPAEIPEALRQLAGGVRRRQRRLLEEIDGALVLAEGERRSVAEDFGVSPRAALVPNGAALAEDGDPPPGLPGEFLVCVGRIEARKNQHALLDAAERLDLPVVFVGALNVHHRALTARFRARVDASSRARWLSRLDRPAVSATLRAAACHVLPSWCEVVPLVDLEAAAAGTRVVTTQRGHTDEYLGDGATYWDPTTGAGGLAASVERALSSPRLPPREDWTWERAGRALLSAYEGF